MAGLKGFIGGASFVVFCRRVILKFSTIHLFGKAGN
jgi:hypothetical protein